MATTTAHREQSDSRTPEPKAPPRRMREEARRERDRRKACHGNWYACGSKGACA